MLTLTSIDHFQDIPMESQTTDITHFAVVFHYDVTIKAMETLQSTANYSYDVIVNSEKTAKCVMSLVWRVPSFANFYNCVNYVGILYIHVFQCMSVIACYFNFACL